MRYNDRFKETLFNPSAEDEEKREPLLKFSFKDRGWVKG